jgi:hypothetical protein
MITKGGGMKSILVIVFILIVYSGYSFSYAGENICMFSNSDFDCGGYSLCEEMLSGIKSEDHRDSLLSKLFSKKEFLILLENIRGGKECAQALGFKMYEVALDSSAPGYLEDLSISLSYSIENNPDAFIKKIPRNLLGHSDIMINLCCGVYEEYREDNDYIKMHLLKRLEQIAIVKDAYQVSKIEIIKKTIQNYLNDYYQD